MRHKLRRIVYSGSTWLWIKSLVACALLISAAIKVISLSTDPFWTLNIVFSPRMMLFAAGVETIVAIFILMTRNELTSWTISAGFAFLLLMVGAITSVTTDFDCGCFGKFDGGKWTSVIVSLGILAIVAVAMPHSVRTQLARRHFIRFVQAVPRNFRVFAVGMIPLLIAIFVADSISPWLESRLKRCGIFVVSENGFVNLPPKPANSWIQSELEIVNTKSIPIRLVGGTAHCNCVMIDDLPLTILPRDAVRVTAHIRYPKTTGTFRLRAQIFTDMPNAIAINAIFQGRSEAENMDISIGSSDDRISVAACRFLEPR